MCGCCKTNDVGNVCFVNVVKPIVVATLVSEMLSNHTFYNIPEHSVTKTIGFTIFSKIMLLKPLALQ